MSVGTTSQSSNHTSVVAISNNDYFAAPGQIATPGHNAAANYLVAPNYLAALATSRVAESERLREQLKQKDMAVAHAAVQPPLRNMDMQFGKDEAVTLIVGEEKHEMLVHANHISRNSEFFRAALKKEWLEGQTRIMTLPVDDPKTVTHYLNFTYNGRLPAEPGEEGPIIDWATPTLLRTHKYLAELYALGVRLLDDAVRNAVNKQILQIHRIWEIAPGEDSIDIIYKGTSERDPARRLMVDIYLSWANGDCLDKEADPAFLFDVAQELFRKLEEAQPYLRGDTDDGMEEDQGLDMSAYLI